MAAALRDTSSRAPDRAERINSAEACALSTARPSRSWRCRPRVLRADLVALDAGRRLQFRHLGRRRRWISRPGHHPSARSSRARRPGPAAPSARGRHSSPENTPMTWRLTPAGLVSGPRILNTVRMPSSRRGPMAWRMALWCAGANMKPTPTSLMARATCSGDRSRGIPRYFQHIGAAAGAGNRPVAVLGHFRAPAAATAKLEPVETLNRLAPSPPVPTRSTRWGPLHPHRRGQFPHHLGGARDLVNGLALDPQRYQQSPPIWASPASPDMTWRMTAAISSRANPPPATATPGPVGYSSVSAVCSGKLRSRSCPCAVNIDSG